MMTLLSGAGTVVMWCMAVVIAMAVAAVAAMWAWDKWSGWKWEQKMRGRR